MTKIVFISDTHGFCPAVPDGDILVHAGDLTMRGRPAEVYDAARWLKSLPHKYKVVVAGNHDFLFEKYPKEAQEMLGEGTHYLENSGTLIRGLRFWGSPITPWFCDWAFNRERGSEIRKYWDQIPPNTHILITHGPPLGILDQADAYKNTQHCGCADLLAHVKVAKPLIHVFGHIHGGYGHTRQDGVDFYNASVVNESYKISNEPWVVEI